MPDHVDSRYMAAVRRSLLVFFVAGAASAVGWWCLMPHGFPVAHRRFWVNTILPWALLGSCLFGILAASLRMFGAMKALSLLSGTAMFSAALSAACIFPESIFGRLFFCALVCGALGICLPVTVFRALPDAPGLRRALKVVCVAVGFLCGVGAVWAQRSTSPGTAPHGGTVPECTGKLDNSGDAIRLVSQVTVFPSRKKVTVTAGPSSLSVSPMLTFHSRSPDRCWTIFAADERRVGPQRLLDGAFRDGPTVTLSYRDDDRSWLQVNAAPADGVIGVEAVSSLPEAVYSHLNTFCELDITGTGRLALSFSPCPEPIEMKAFDYPAGRPARLACVDAQDRFCVVEAHSGEKGPFTTLAKGTLRRGEPLAIVIMENGKAVFRVTLDDWSSQASTELSPTAGWGLPENAIEFSLVDSSQGSIYITLAGTSVGRGWDSVGHAAGVYWNRMRIEVVDGSK